MIEFRDLVEKLIGEPITEETRLSRIDELDAQLAAEFAAQFAAAEKRSAGAS